MEFIRGLCNLHPHPRRSVCTIGAFDGVHLGHQQVLRHLRASAQKRKARSVVVTFEPLPREFINPRQAPARIHSIYEKCATLRTQNIDALLCIRFNQALREIQAESFVVDVFMERLNMCHMVVGDDLHFGHKQQGDFSMLERLGARLGFTAERTPTFSMDAVRVSSTRIRRALQDADFDLAGQLLGRPYAVEAKVLPGKRLGHKLGFPTANIPLHQHRVPLSGVYAAEVQLVGEPRLYRAVVNVGRRPTVSSEDKVVLEAHLLDYRGDLYRRKLKVFFKRRLRAEQQFDSLEELKTRIAEDVRATRAYFSA